MMIVASTAMVEKGTAHLPLNCRHLASRVSRRVDLDQRPVASLL
jgi:hypothetical protein